MMDLHLSPEKIIAFVDGHADPQVVEEVLRHIKNCSHCWQEMENLLYVDHYASSPGYMGTEGVETDLPPDLEQAVHMNWRALLENGPGECIPMKDPLPLGNQGRTFGLRKTVLAIAAGILILLTPYLFDRTLMLTSVNIRWDPTDPTKVYRSPSEHEYYRFEVTFPESGYFYILSLDQDKSLSMIYPYYSFNKKTNSEKWNYFNTEGPFSRNQATTIPPHIDPRSEEPYNGYYYNEAEGLGFFFVIPSEKQLDNDTLLGFIKLLKDPEIMNEMSLEYLSTQVHQRLEALYPGTLKFPP